MNRQYLIAFLLALATCFMSCKSSEKGSIVLSDKLDSLLSTNEAKPFNGIVLITKDGKTEYSTIKGYADLDTRTLLKLEDLFIIGSISKQFTTAIILQEYNKGRLDLYKPIKYYLPDITQGWADTVTVHNLLTHTHGIQSLDKAAKFPIGSQFEYSQIGYDLLAKIAEVTSGKPFAELSQELFKRCGMNNTFHPEIKHYENLVKGYNENEDGKLEYTNEALNQYTAAGGFISTAEDLALWNKLFFEGTLFNKNTFQIMTTKQENAVRNHPVFGITEYGYGITIDDREGLVQWGQTGLIPGFVSMNFYFPKSKTSVIVLENIYYDTSDLKKTFYYHTGILDIVRDGLLN